MKDGGREKEGKRVIKRKCVGGADSEGEETVIDNVNLKKEVSSGRKEEIGETV